MIAVPTHPVYNLTPFQARFVAELEAHPGFGRWVGVSVPDDQEPRPQGPLVMPWYDASGRLHAVRVGRGRVLHEVAAEAVAA